MCISRPEPMLCVLDGTAMQPDQTRGATKRPGGHGAAQAGRHAREGAFDGPVPAPEDGRVHPARTGPLARTPELGFDLQAVELAQRGHTDAATRHTHESERSQMDPYSMKVQVEYTQQELARARGHRNWVSLFKRS